MREERRTHENAEKSWPANLRRTPRAARLCVVNLAALVLVALTVISTVGCSRTAKERVQQVEFKAADGFRLRGTVWLPKTRGKHPGVLMFANLNQDRGTYKKLGEQLADTGLVAFAVDLRVQGGSVEANQDRDPFSPSNLRNLSQDALAALGYLRRRKEVDPTRVAVVAADGVVELVHRTIWNDSSVVAVALLSPLFPDSLADSLATHPPRPLFLACSFDDPGAAQVTKAIADASPNPRSLVKFYFACGYGTDMLWSPEGDALTTLLRTWLADVLLGG